MFLVTLRMNAAVLSVLAGFVCVNRSTITCRPHESQLLDYHAVRGVNVVDSHAKCDCVCK